MTRRDEVFFIVGVLVGAIGMVMVTPTKGRTVDWNVPCAHREVVPGAPGRCLDNIR